MDSKLVNLRLRISTAFDLPVCHIEKCRLVGWLDFVMVDTSDYSLFTLYYCVPQNRFDFHGTLRKHYIMPLYEFCGDKFFLKAGIEAPDVQEFAEWRSKFLERWEAAQVENNTSLTLR